TGSIYVTEIPDSVGGAPGPLNVVLARSFTGDIRLTVAETTSQHEDLNLLPCSGDASRLFFCSVRCVEKKARTTTTDNGDGKIARGLIQSDTGSVLLRVGDNVTTDGFNGMVATDETAALVASVRAGKWNDIFGDFANS